MCIRDRGVSFTYTFDKRVEITGNAKIKLWMQAQGAEDMDVFVRYYKVNANGARMFSDDGMGRYYGPQGKLRVSHRMLDAERSTLLKPVHKHTEEKKLREGEIVVIEIPIWPTGLVFEQGQTLKLDISARDYVEDRPPHMIETTNINRGKHVLYAGGAYDSCIVLPVCADS